MPGKTQIAFLLTASELDALKAWILATYGGSGPSVHEGARAIVLTRLQQDGAFDSKARPCKTELSGAELRRVRKARGCTQKVLAGLFDVPRSTLALWESGHKKVPARLVPVVRQWIETGKSPEPGELGRRKHRSAWVHLLDD